MQANGIFIIAELGGEAGARIREINEQYDPRLARYKAPVTVIVFNNRSYNNERNRIWVFTGGNQLKSGRDMTCYNGNPDVDFAKASIAFGVEAETVTNPDAIAGALKRAKRANIEGRPYLLDVVVQRYGVGWASTYYPEHSIAASRKRMV